MAILPDQYPACSTCNSADRDCRSRSSSSGPRPSPAPTGSRRSASTWATRRGVWSTSRSTPGVNAFDTANLYSRGDSETVLAEALAGRRDKALIFSKAGFPMTEAPNDRGASRVHLMDQVEKSLRRLRTDYLDLYFIHLWDGLTPVEETVDAMSALVARRQDPLLGRLELQRVGARQDGLDRGGRGPRRRRSASRSTTRRKRARPNTSCCPRARSWASRR